MRERGRRWLACAAVLAVSNAALAADVPAAAGATFEAADAGIERVRFRNIGTRDGLSQSTAAALAQDTRGFIWIGTQDGLNRFDGYGFRVYKHDRADPYSLSDNHVRRLLADSRGRLWVGTQNGGLGRYDPALDRFDTFRPNEQKPGSLSGRVITALMEDRDHRIWVASLGGLQWFDEKTGRFEASRCERDVTKQVIAMAQGRDGALMFGTEGGLMHCDPTSGATVEWRHDGDRLASATQVLQVGPHGELWVSVGGQGLFLFEADGRASRRLTPTSTPPMTDESSRGLLLDRDGLVWFGSESRGVSRFDPATGRIENFRHQAGRDYSLASNRAFTLMQDRDGLIWIGTWGNGTSVFDARTSAFVQLHPGAGENALPGASATSVLMNPDGTFWIGTLEDGGLSRFDLHAGVVERHVHDPSRPDSLSHNFISALARAEDGTLWVGTSGGGLDRLRPGSRGSFDHFRNNPVRVDSLSSDVVQGLYLDAERTLWVSTDSKGLNALCDGCSTFRRYPHVDGDPDSLGGSAVQNVRRTRAGETWVALRRQGLDRLDPATGKAEHFRADPDDPTSLSSPVVTAIHEDRRGTLWIGTQGGGLNRLVRAANGAISFEAITTREGLSADAIGGIAEDAEGRLWLSTTVGLTRYDPATRTVLNIGGARGAFDTGYFIDAAHQGANGSVIFGGPAGATVFDPADVRIAAAPRPLFTDLRLFNAPVALRWRDPQSPLVEPPWNGGVVELGHRQSMLSLDFGAPTAADPESVRYAYRLEPHDDDWIETDATRRTATYTLLPAGDYRLRVRARYAGEPWGKDEAELRLRVRPAPWASLSARLLYLVGAGTVGWLVWRRWRVAQRRRDVAQESIRVSEERLKMALWGSGAELWDVYMPSGRMHRENKLEHLAVHVEAAEETVTSYRPFVHPDDLLRFEDAMRRHLHGEAETFECSYRTYDRAHEWVWILTRGRIVERDAAGRATRITGTTHDINALKRAEEALRRLNEELELRVERRTTDLRTANVELQHALDRLTLTQRQLLESEKLASLGGLVAGIAHEINTPLGVSVTAASHLAEEAGRMSRQLVDNTLKRSDLERFQQLARESSELILRNLQRADRLVKSFKQVAVDQSSEDRRTIELGGCINEILTTLGPTLKKTPHQIEVVCAQPVVCETAPGALYQIVSNLVMNSLLHAFPATVAGSIRIVVSRDGPVATIEYRDDGVGMDEATRARMFDPFFTTRRGQGGSGLGMHIVYNLVTQVLGGTIDVDSTPGEGVRIRMHFAAGAHAT